MLRKTYLVTGGCGFIGSHLVDQLIHAHHQVIVLDNLSSGKRANLHPQAELVIGDIRDIHLAQSLMKRVEGCFHLAAIVSVELCNRNWVDSHAVNLTGTLNIFDAAQSAHKNNKPIPVIYASSCAVYGDNTDLPLNETACPTPISAYGIDKLGCEYHAQIATRIHGVPTTGLRFFNVYGPRQDPHSPYSGVISIFLEKLLQGGKLPIYGDGEQTRDFIYITDVVATCIKAMQLQPEKQSPIYNVCTGKVSTINNLAKLLSHLLQKPLTIDYLPSRPEDISHSQGNPAKIYTAFDIKTHLPLEAGLHQLIQFIGKT